MGVPFTRRVLDFYHHIIGKTAQETVSPKEALPSAVEPSDIFGNYLMIRVVHEGDREIPVHFVYGDDEDLTKLVGQVKQTVIELLSREKALKRTVFQKVLNEDWGLDLGTFINSVPLYGIFINYYNIDLEYDTHTFAPLRDEYDGSGYGIRIILDLDLSYKDVILTQC